MDGQNMGNEQNTQNTETAKFSNYQDNTANMSYQAPVESAEPAKANTLQIIGLVCGIAGIILGCCTGWVGLILGIAGLICAIFGNKQGKTGVGTAGFICSIVAIVLSVIVLIVSVVFGAAMLSALSEAGYYYY